MLLPTTSVLRELLIRELASAPNQTAGVVLASLQKRGHSFSKQGVYKELRQLESQGVVTRAQGKYSLRSSVEKVLYMKKVSDRGDLCRKRRNHRESC